MPLVKGPRSKVFIGSSNPRPSHITDSERLSDALFKSQQEVLRMREQMEFLAFLVKRAWQGDRNAMADVASIVGVKEAANEDLLHYTGQENSDSDKWANMVEQMLQQEKEKDEQQTSTVKLVQREMMLEDELENHTPVFSSYLNKPRGNFRQKRPASAAPPRVTQSRVMTTPQPPLSHPSATPQPPLSHPSATPQPPLSHHSLGAEPTAPQSTPRPVSAPGPRKGFRPGSAASSRVDDNVSVHGSEILINHNSKPGRCNKHPRTDRCNCPVVRCQSEGPWQDIPRFGVPTSANFWTDDGNIRFVKKVLREKDHRLVAILCAAGK